MPSDIELGVATMFRDATMQSVTLELRKEADWDRFNTIKETARAHIKDEVDSFERNKPELLAAARKDIIDKAGALTFEHPAPFGTDRFSKTEVERQAVTKVFNAHESKLLGIRNDEAQAYDSLKQDIHTREGARDHARDAFARSTDRRDGQERRGPARER